MFQSDIFRLDAQPKVVNALELLQVPSINQKQQLLATKQRSST